jgi:hypothetical protein
MIRLLCPRGDEIATVDVVGDAIIPEGTEHGLILFDYSPQGGYMRVRATCPRCSYTVGVEGGGYIDYGALRDELKAAIAAGRTEHTVGFLPN